MHTTTVYTGNRGTPQTILNLSTRQTQEVNFMPKLLQPQVLTEQGAWSAQESRNILDWESTHSTTTILPAPSQLLWTQQEHTMPRVK